MNEEEKRFVSTSKASTISGLHPHTLRKLADQGVFKCFVTPSGQRRYDSKYLQDFVHNSFTKEEVKDVQRTNFLYARVSSKKQEDDLNRQINFLKEYTNDEEGYELIADIGSGINFKRKGLSTILDACLQGSIGKVIVAHRDRLCRFGFELIEQLIVKSGGSIKVINDNKDQSSEEELASDLLSIVHIFTCKQMGRRKYKGKKVQNDQNKNLSNQGPTNNSQ